MNYYIKKNKGFFIGTIVCAIISTIFAVLAQFLKGDVLDYAISGNKNTTLLYAVLLIGFILVEISFFYFHDRLTAIFVTKCYTDLKEGLFHSILKRNYVEFKKQSQGEYIAKYTNDIDMIVNMYFTSWIAFIQILIKVVFVSVALFLLDVRVAIITLFLLTTPLYVPLLKDFSMEMKEGKFYLLKGPSGCGKTTVTNLLLKYYETDSGSISIGNIPISKISNIYDYITVVRQDAVLFHDTLRNNLTMYQDYKDDEITNQLKRLGLYKYANPEGLNMMITEDGSNLSGGERKRVCLARALLRESDIIILDEPLANLDDATALSIENEIFQIRDKTVLVVSHQFSKENIRRFDLIIEM